MRYFATCSEDVRTMLRAVSKDNLDDLFSSIPADARCKENLHLPTKLDELGIKRYFSKLTAPSAVSFLGAGATAHFVPAWVSQQLMRAEWYTSYTPYQPEASQGTLQAIFEFQSMVASLLGLDIANASMYDGATALVEALLMATRITGKKAVLISSSIHPEYRQCVKTYFSLSNFRVVEIGFDAHGHTDLSELNNALNAMRGEIAAVATQSPNFFGRFENIADIAKLAHEHQALAVVNSTDMSALPLIEDFGNSGADIAVGEGLGLLGGLCLGGPGVGLLSCRKDFLRQLPGRLVGRTYDQQGRPGYVLTLSTREQHIRREKATSNICTNHSLMALAFSMTLAAYGKRGFLDLAKTNLKKTLHFRQCLKRLGHSPAFDGPHYNETVINLGSSLSKRLRIATSHNLLAGVSLEGFYPNLSGYLLVTCTELHQADDIERLAAILCGAHDDEA